MAKTQKNLQFHEDVLEWFNHTELATGASHSRIALAAILGYVLLPENEQANLMYAAVQMDRGERGFAETARFIAQARADQARHQLEAVEMGAQPDRIREHLAGQLQTAERIVSKVSQQTATANLVATLKAPTKPTRRKTKAPRS